MAKLMLNPLNSLTRGAAVGGGTGGARHTEDEIKLLSFLNATSECAATIAPPNAP